MKFKVNDNRILAILGIVALVFAWWLQQDLAPRSVPSTSQRQMTAAALYAEYEANEIKADATFRRGVLLTGRVKDIGKDISGEPYLVLGEYLESNKGIQAMFPDGSPLASLTRGDMVSVSCQRSQGLVVMNVILRDCVLQ